MEKVVVVVVAILSAAVVAQIEGDYRLELTGLEAQERIQAREFSVQSYVARLLYQAVLNEDVNAFIGFDIPTAMNRAKEADIRERQGTGGLLNGIPFLVKDNIQTPDYPCTAGTPALVDNDPDITNPVVADLMNAGAVLLGTTNMHELAFGITSDNYWTGPVLNPYDRSLFAGGSSGGSGAGVAARMAPVALGTDTGGSVRIPAALNGIFGFRPTQYRYDSSSVVPISTYRDTIGLMARSMADIRAFDEVITDDFTSPPVVLSNLRLAVDRSTFFTGLDAETQVVMDAALAALTAAGVELVEVDASDTFATFEPCSSNVVFYEFVPNMTSYLASTPNQYSTDELVSQIASPDVAGVVGGIFSGDIPRMTQQEYDTTITVSCENFKDYYFGLITDVSADGFILPTTVLPARPNSPTFEVELNGEDVNAFFTYIQNTEYAATAQGPGISIPAGLTVSGLPVGIEIDGVPNSDRRLINIAEAVASALAPTPRPADILYSAGSVPAIFSVSFLSVLAALLHIL
mmetsp:Transcript_18373/g.51853  ORF Transcript_18373/g.51853 Transcript_18373/m.51853 type:complete len:519 (+) Transcript_18373:156-1712(+)